MSTNNTQRAAAELILGHRRAVHRLPVFEQHVLLNWFKGLLQTEMAQLFQCSQPTVCYRIERALHRLDLIVKLPTLTGEEIRTALRGYEETNVVIILAFYESSSQNVVAAQIGRTQGFVRARIGLIYETLQNEVFELSTGRGAAPATVEATEVLKYLKDTPREITKRDLHRALHNRSWVKSIRDIDRALSVLVAQGCIRLKQADSIEDDSMLERAVRFLRITLKKEPLPAHKINALAKEKGISFATLRRARLLVCRAGRGGPRDLYKLAGDPVRRIGRRPSDTIVLLEGCQAPVELLILKQQLLLALDIILAHPNFLHEVTFPKTIDRTLTECSSAIFVAAHFVCERDPPVPAEKEIVKTKAAPEIAEPTPAVTEAQICKTIAEMGTCTAQELAARLNMRVGDLRRVLAPLCRSGVVRQHGRGSSIMFFIV